VLQQVKEKQFPRCSCLHFSSAAISTCLHADGLATMMLGSTSRNPEIPDTSKVPSLQIQSHAHSES
jgi:hypothetical protein